MLPLLIFDRFKDLIQYYYPDYAKVIYKRETRDDEEFYDVSGNVKQDIHEQSIILQDRDQLNDWVVNNIMHLKKQKKQEKYNLKRDAQLYGDNNQDLILFSTRHLFRHLALYLRIQNISQGQNVDINKSIMSIMSRSRGEKFQQQPNIDLDLEIALEEQIVIEYYQVIQKLIKE